MFSNPGPGALWNRGSQEAGGPSERTAAQRRPSTPGPRDVCPALSLPRDVLPQSGLPRPPPRGLRSFLLMRPARRHPRSHQAQREQGPGSHWGQGPQDAPAVPSALWQEGHRLAPPLAEVAAKKMMLFRAVTSRQRGGARTPSVRLAPDFLLTRGPLP